MSEHELTAMAMRAVAADLDKLLFDRPEITARVSSGSETRFVHQVIRNTVNDLRDRLNTLADDEGIDLQVGA